MAQQASMGMSTTRLPEWRYQIRRTVVGVVIVIATLIVIGTITSWMGIDICAEDYCYEILPTTT